MRNHRGLNCALPNQRLKLSARGGRRPRLKRDPLGSPGPTSFATLKRASR